MKRVIITAATGALFGLGLVVAGMTKTHNVVGFLDLFGSWNPSLGLVMLAAVAVHFTAMRLILERPKPVFEKEFQLPHRKDLEPRLFIGAGLFGIGWGLGGYCPGPGLVAAASGAPAALMFLATMTAGMLLHRWMENVLLRRAPGLPAQQQKETS